jgi:hypothetical protein
MPAFRDCTLHYLTAAITIAAGTESNERRAYLKAWHEAHWATSRL